MRVVGADLVVSLKLRAIFLFSRHIEWYIFLQICIGFKDVLQQLNLFVLKTVFMYSFYQCKLIISVTSIIGKLKEPEVVADHWFGATYWITSFGLLVQPSSQNSRGFCNWQIECGSQVTFKADTHYRRLNRFNDMSHLKLKKLQWEQLMIDAVLIIK